MNIFIFGNNNISVDVIKILLKYKVQIKGFCFTQKNSKKMLTKLKKYYQIKRKFLYIQKEKIFITKLKN